ncbi:SAM-dependent methyltransferase [Leptobacterium sp. I13]|uniref:SAM-dependent methyltransferase n=1 Tax=Leptobacterium meishanense TaxID=3128904 RepID=UPI0030ED81B6
MKLNKEYWENRYQNKSTKWDIGYVSTPIKEYLDQIHNKNTKILLPGGGNGYEAVYAFNSGFKNTFLLDIAKHPLENFKNQNPSFPDTQIIKDDFFNHQEKYDLIIEQTFFCALLPEQRSAYAKKAATLLNEKGIIAGVLFNFPLTEKGPPFGGSIDEYKSCFSPYFNIHKLETCYNSIKPREDNELFFIFEKK